MIEKKEWWNIMVKKITMWVIVQQIERNWKQIHQNRKAMEQLLLAKEPYTSPKLVELEQSNLELGYAASLLEKRYRTLAGSPYM